MKYIIILIIGIVIGLLITQKACNDDTTKKEELYNLIQDQKEELTTYQNKIGEQVAEIKSFKLSNAKYLKDATDANDRLKRLQKVVKNFKKPEAVIIHDVKTVFVDTGSIMIKTITGSGTQIDYPIVLNLKNEWIDAEAKGYEQGSGWSVSVVNRFKYGFEKKNLGLFGSNGSEYTIKAISENPYTTTSELTSLIIKSKQKKIHIGPHLGIDITGKPTFGLSVQYSFLSF